MTNTITLDPASKLHFEDVNSNGKFDVGMEKIKAGASTLDQYKSKEFLDSIISGVQLGLALSPTQITEALHSYYTKAASKMLDKHFVAYNTPDGSKKLWPLKSTINAISDSDLGKTKAFPGTGFSSYVDPIHASSSIAPSPFTEKHPMFMTLHQHKSYHLRGQTWASAGAGLSSPAYVIPLPSHLSHYKVALIGKPADIVGPFGYSLNIFGYDKSYKCRDVNKYTKYTGSGLHNTIYFQNWKNESVATDYYQCVIPTHTYRTVYPINKAKGCNI